MTSRLDEKILASIKLEYPFPLSFTYISMKNAEEIKGKLDKSIEVLESIVKYLTLISLSTSLRAPIGTELSNFILSWLPRPSLGTWNAALRELLGAYHTRPEDLFLPEIYHFYFRTNKKSSDNARIIDDLIRERNKIAHGGAPSTTKECEQKVSEIEPKIEELMSNLSFLRDYDLNYLRYSKKEQATYHHAVKVCMGAFSQFENKSISTDSSENSNHMYLYHRERNALLDLHPFIVYSDKFEGAGGPELFFYNRIQENKVSYMNYQAGHSFNDAELFLEFESGIMAKLNSQAMVKELKYQQYKKYVLEIWKFGRITPEDEDKLLGKQNELGITSEEAQRIEVAAKEELFARYMDELIGLLDKEDQKERAVQTIVGSGHNAIPYLIQALENDAIHGELVKILLSFGDDALKPLITALCDEKRRIGAQKALRELSASALPLLIGDLEKEAGSPEVEETLIFFEGIAVSPLIDLIREKERKAQEGGLKLVSLKEDNAWKRAVAILRKIGKPAALELVKHLADPILEETASQTIRDIGESSYDALVGVLTDEKLCKLALSILRIFGQGTILPVLNETVKYGALEPVTKEFIVSFGSDAVPQLVTALKTGICRELVISVLKLYPETYPPQIIPLLVDSSLLEIVEALLTEIPEYSIAPLIKSLDDGILGESIEGLLEKMPPDLVLTGILERVREKGKNFLSNLVLGGKIESGVRDVLKDLSKHKIFGTVMETVKLKTESLEDSVKTLRDPFTRRSLSLISKMPSEALKILLDNLEEGELFDYLRLALQSAREGIIPEIIATIPGKSEKIRERCIVILSDIGAPAVPYLVENLLDESLRPTCLETLVKIGPQGAGEIAKGLLDEETREYLKEVLLTTGPTGFRYYVQYLGVPIIGETLEEIILKMGSGVVSELIDGVADVSSMEQCIRLLKKMGDKASEGLVNALKNEEITTPLIEILREIGPSSIPLMFEKYRGESSAVSSFIKSIISLGKKQESPATTPLKKALTEVSALYPIVFLEICSSPKNRDLALPLLSDIMIYIAENEDLKLRDDSIALIRDYIRNNSLAGVLKPHILSRQGCKSSVKEKTIKAMEL